MFGRALRSVDRLVHKRCLHLQEHESKTLLRDAGIRVQPFGVATTPEEAAEVAIDLSRCGEMTGLQKWVVKAQVLAGGRGRGTFSNGFGGGIKLCDSPESVASVTANMLHQRLVTKQTDADGLLVKAVMVARAIDITSEAYLSVIWDVTEARPMFLVCREGGVGIEESQRGTNSASTLKRVIVRDFDVGPTSENIRDVVAALGLAHDIETLERVIRSSYDVFITRDATQLEINPLAVAEDGNLYAVDAKISIDDAALFRQPRENWDYRRGNGSGPKTAGEEDSAIKPVPLANEMHTNYIRLDGDIGCLVNGAGLAMATMDVILNVGARPANFLDIGGTATAETVSEAIQMIQSDPAVRSILINIFGGIVRCDDMARGIVLGLSRLQELPLPIVIRLAGTNAEEGRRILKESRFVLDIAETIEEAAIKARDQRRAVESEMRPPRASLNASGPEPLTLESAI